MAAVIYSRSKAFFFMLTILAVLFFTSCISPRQHLIGSVHIYGSEPHTYVGIVSEKDDKMYVVQPKEKEAKLRTLQGRRIDFTVTVNSGQTAVFPGAAGIVTPLSWKIL